MSRTEKSVKNIIYDVIGQFFGIAISFVARTFFISYLGAEYLGINGLFSNVLSILSLAEMGIGTAIVFSLYNPLAVDDTKKIKALMALFKKAYTLVGIVIISLGFALTPFLPLFFTDVSAIENIKLFFMLFILNSGISYFFTYKRSLIIADQKRYITTKYKYAMLFIVNAIQIAVLISTRNYAFFLIVQIICTLTENILISRKADSLYPYLKSKNTVPLTKEDKEPIYKNIRAMIMHKVGGALIGGTKNILMSVMVNVIVVGIYSNYLLIINAIHSIISLILQSIVASIGNLGASESNKKKNFIFEVLNFVVFWIYGLLSICLLFMLNPFINLWLGSEFLFDKTVVVIIVVNAYLQGMRYSVLTYRDALGLYWYDRYKPVFEIIINITASILLGTKFGVAGILVGTTVSTITVSFWIEPLMLFKYGFQQRVSAYFKRYGIYTLTCIAAGAIVYIATLSIKTEAILGLALLLCVCLIVPNVVFLLVYHRSKEFKYLIQAFKKLITQFRQRHNKAAL